MTRDEIRAFLSHFLAAEFNLVISQSYLMHDDDTLQADWVMYDYPVEGGVSRLKGAYANMGTALEAKLKEDNVILKGRIMFPEDSANRFIKARDLVDYIAELTQ